MTVGTALTNQDFVTYQGDDVLPIFTVYADATLQTTVDISTVSEITWTAQRNTESGVVIALTKKKSLAQIALIGGGLTGQFQVTITKVDTAALDGYYMHVAKLTDAVGNVSTCTVGRMQVGLHPAWTYDQTMLATTPLYQVRRLIGDVLQGDLQLMDAEIDWAIATYGNIYLAGAECCRDIAAQYARKVDTVQGELRTLYAQQTKNYGARAYDLEQRGLMIGTTPYAGGISITDKTNQVLDTDRVPPQFNLMMDDNFLPTGMVGNQTPIPGSPDFSASDNYPV